MIRWFVSFLTFSNFSYSTVQYSNLSIVTIATVTWELLIFEQNSVHKHISLSDYLKASRWTVELFEQFGHYPGRSLSGFPGTSLAPSREDYIPPLYEERCVWDQKWKREDPRERQEEETRRRGDQRSWNGPFLASKRVEEIPVEEIPIQNVWEIRGPCISYGSPQSWRNPHTKCMRDPRPIQNVWEKSPHKMYERLPKVTNHELKTWQT